MPEYRTPLRSPEETSEPMGVMNLLKTLYSRRSPLFDDSVNTILTNMTQAGFGASPLTMRQGGSENGAGRAAAAVGAEGLA